MLAVETKNIAQSGKRSGNTNYKQNNQGQSNNTRTKNNRLSALVTSKVITKLKLTQ